MVRPCSSMAISFSKHAFANDENRLHPFSHPPAAERISSTDSLTGWFIFSLWL